MNKIFLLALISFTSLSLASQNVAITVYQNSIELQNDSLFFKYRIENNSDTTLVLFNANTFKNIVNFVDKNLLKENTERRITSLYAFIGKNEYYPFPNQGLGSNLFMSMDSVKVENNSVSRYSKEEYIVLSPHSHIELNTNLLLRDKIWSIHGKDYFFYSLDLTKGVYEFQLYYFSSKYNEREYINAKRTDVRLKDSIMFEGILESNKCYFTYPYFGRQLR